MDTYPSFLGDDKGDGGKRANDGGDEIGDDAATHPAGDDESAGGGRYVNELILFLHHLSGTMHLTGAVLNLVGTICVLIVASMNDLDIEKVRTMSSLVANPNSPEGKLFAAFSVLGNLLILFSHHSFPPLLLLESTTTVTLILLLLPLSLPEKPDDLLPLPPLEGYLPIHHLLSNVEVLSHSDGC